MSASSSITPRIRDGIRGHSFRAVFFTQGVMIAIIAPISAGVWALFGEATALISVPVLCLLAMLAPGAYDAWVRPSSAPEQTYRQAYWHGRVGWLQSLVIRGLAALHFPVAIYRFLRNCNIGYSQFRRFSLHRTGTDAIRKDIGQLWEKPMDFDKLPPGGLSYAESIRKSRLVLLVAQTLSSAQSNFARSPQPGYASIIRRAWVSLLGWRLGTAITDAAKFARRLFYRRRSEFNDMAILGRILGMGRIPAAEVPALMYCMPGQTDSFKSLYDTWEALSVPRLSLEQEVIHKSSLTGWLMLGQMTWRRIAFRDYHNHPGEKTSEHIVILPTLVSDKASRTACIQHFRPQRPPPGGYCTFEDFLSRKLEEYRSSLGLRKPFVVVCPLATPVEEYTVDGLCLAVLVGLEIAATELRRRPSVIHERLLEDFDRKLWDAYEEFFGQAAAFLSRDGESADAMSLKYGIFLKWVFRASGRREIQGLQWAIFNRELPRWRLLLAPSTRYIARDFDREILRSAPASESVPTEAGKARLFEACLVPCKQARCKANWDPALLFLSSNVDALDLIARIVILACRHIKGAGQFDRVVGVAQGGVIPAAAIALILRKTLSIVYSDNIMNVVPQAAVAERWLLVDDAYQTGYAYQAIRSQMIGLKRMPSPRESFVLFKAESQFDADEGGAFKLASAMRDTRSEIGYALSYQYGPKGAAPSHYPDLVHDQTGDLDQATVDGVRELIRHRIAATTERLALEGREAALRRVIRIIKLKDFMKTEVLFDHPDVVMEIGRMLHDQLKEEGLLAYVAGSAKAIPFLVAANLAAMCETGTTDLPFIVTIANGELRYSEVLLHAARKRMNTKLAYFDVSFRSGATLAGAEKQIEELSKQSPTPFVLVKKLVLASVREPTQIPQEIQVMIPEIHIMIPELR